MRTRLREYVASIREGVHGLRTTVGGMIEEYECRRHANELEQIANDLDEILREGAVGPIKLPSPEQLAKLLASINGVDADKPGWELFIPNAQKLLK